MIRQWLRDWLGISELETRLKARGELLVKTSESARKASKQAQAAWEGIKEHLLDHNAVTVLWDITGQERN